jgi:RNA polymerase sigma-70 factor (ECF subfamily)
LAHQDAAEASLHLRHAMAKLTTADREILLLREFEELSYAEIAELLRLPLNTVRSRLFCARTVLRDLLQAPAPAPAAPKLTEFEEHA